MILQKIIDHYGKQLQTFVAIEEMAELTKELTKNMHGEQNHNAMVEEIADVYIMLKQVMIMNYITIEEVTIMINKKLERMKERLEKEEHESV